MKNITHFTFPEELKIIGIKIGYCSSYDQFLYKTYYQIDHIFWNGGKYHTIEI